MTLDEKMAELCRLLDEMYDNYFAKGDGYCKSSEGRIELSYAYGNYWDRLPANANSEYESERRHVQQVGPKGPTVYIYSYVFGLSPAGRGHYFDSVDEALEAVRGAHAEEMARDYDELGWMVNGERAY